MEALLDRRAFPGPSIDAAAAGLGFPGLARFDGCLVATAWARRDVEALLPEELELAPNVSAAPDVHPVVFVFGEHHGGTAVYGGLTVPLAVDYGEFVLAVPFARVRGGPHLHVWVPRMFSSYFPATWSGNVYYGFTKDMARMTWHGPVWVMTGETGELLVHAAVEPAADWSPARLASAHLDPLRAIFALPLVGRRADGTLVTSYFGWDFADAAVRRVGAEVSLDGTLVPGLAPRRCHAVPGGAFEVRNLVWRLSWPAACRP